MSPLDFIVAKEAVSPMVSAQSPHARGTLAVGLALRHSINRIASRLRLGSPRSMLSNSVAVQLNHFPGYEIRSLPHDRFGLVYNGMGLPAPASCLRPIAAKDPGSEVLILIDA